MIFYTWFITNGSFNLLGHERHGLAYGSLLVHMLHGSLEVDRKAIGLEGLYVGNKVYMYYGILPALLRLPLVPFFDLTRTTVSRIIVIAVAVPTAAIWHYLLLRTLEPFRTSLPKLAFNLCLFVAALIAWLLSPSFALCSTAPIYHETIATALLLMSIFTLIVYQGVERDGRITDGRLACLAVVAALSLHSRVEVAIGLYAGTTLFVLAALLALRLRSNSWAANSMRVSRLALPLLILFISGVLYLWMNWLRWGMPFNPAPIKYYGYQLYVYSHGYLGGSTENPSLGRFSLLRIPVNLVAYFVSSEDLALKVGNFFGTGLGRMLETESPMLMIWLGPLIIALCGGVLWLTQARRDRQLRIEYAILIIALSIPALMLLCYPTVNYRYKLLLWPIIFLGVMVGTSYLLQKLLVFNTKILTICLIGFVTLNLASVVEVVRVDTYYKFIRGMDEDGSRSVENFMITRILVPKSQLSNSHVPTFSGFTEIEESVMSGEWWKLHPVEKDLQHK